MTWTIHLNNPHFFADLNGQSLNDGDHINLYDGEAKMLVIVERFGEGPDDYKFITKQVLVGSGTAPEEEE